MISQNFIEYFYKVCFFFKGSSKQVIVKNKFNFHSNSKGLIKNSDKEATLEKKKLINNCKGFLCINEVAFY